jgi:CRISPR/Cas system-associated endoribonuclease Cas2
MADLTTLEIRLSRLIKDDGRMVFMVEVAPAAHNMVEVLGLLEAAKLHFFNQMNDNRRG